MKVFYIMVLVLVAGAVPSHGRTESEGTVFKKTQPHESMNNGTVSSSKVENYNQLYLAMQWPKSYCSYRQCYRPAPGHFTVHGLWPQYDPSRYSGGIDCTTLTYRKEGYPYYENKELDKSLLPDLNYYWPDLTTIEDNNVIGNNNQGFWATEYNKHGSCTFNNQREYFKRALTMLEPVKDLLGKLARTRVPIIPGNSYWPSQITAAVYEVTQTTPRLHCIPVGRKIQLLEIRFCANSNGNPLGNCVFYSNCGKERVYLPGP